MFKHIQTLVAFTVIFCLAFEQSGFAQVAPQIGVPAYLQGLVSPQAFRPVHLRSITLDETTQDVRLLVDKGDAQSVKDMQLEHTTRQLMDYFLVGLRLPNSVFWVNLRPDSDRDIIDPWLEKTELGRILLEADLQLKKDLAALTSPRTKEGKAYWDKLYAKAESVFGRQDVSIPTLTRPWIVPGEVLIKQSAGGAYVYKATLKVMLEQDYIKDSPFYSFDGPRLKQINEYSSELIRTLVLPQMTRDINSARRYAQLRQVYYSLVLAQWFKQNYRGKSTVYASTIDTRDLAGLTSKKQWSKADYYKRYQSSFQKGEYDIEETAATGQGLVIRRYFSGGIRAALGSDTIQKVFTGRETAVPITQVDPSLTEVTFNLKTNDIAVQNNKPASLDGGLLSLRQERELLREARERIGRDSSLSLSQQRAAMESVETAVRGNADVRDELRKNSRLSLRQAENVSKMVKDIKDGGTRRKRIKRETLVEEFGWTNNRKYHFLFDPGVNIEDAVDVMTGSALKALHYAEQFGLDLPASFTDARKTDGGDDQQEAYWRRRHFQIGLEEEEKIVQRKDSGYGGLGGRSYMLDGLDDLDQAHADAEALNRLNDERYGEGAGPRYEVVNGQVREVRMWDGGREDQMQRLSTVIEALIERIAEAQEEMRTADTAEKEWLALDIEELRWYLKEAQAELDALQFEDARNLDGGKETHAIGGIDLRSLPVTGAPSGALVMSVPVDPALLSASLEGLERKWQSIQKNMRSGPMPYAELKEFIAACRSRNDAASQLQAVSSRIVQILKMEECAAVATSPEFEEIIAVL